MWFDSILISYLFFYAIPNVLYNTISEQCYIKLPNNQQNNQNRSTMGGCLQALFNTHRSSLRQDTLLNYQELTTIIKPSTQNDGLFYSSHNLSSVQKFLTEYSLKPSKSIDAVMVKTNIEALTKFILDLKDQSSEVGKQILVDKQRIKSYLGKNVNDHNIKANAVILRLELQILLLGASLVEELSYNQDWDLVIDIQEEQPGSRYNSKISGSRQISTSYQNQLQSQPQLIESIWVNDRMKQSGDADIKKNNIKSDSLSSRSKNEPDLSEYSLFTFASKVVNKNSIIRISLSKVKRKKYLSFADDPKVPKNQVKFQQKEGRNTDLKNKVLLGFTCLSVSDFIYYNSLILSDVISLSPPTSIKSSITTSASSSTANAVAFITLRGQGLRAQSLQKDYIKIIKQHQIVLQQLQFCLEGEKGWQKLSQFRNSNESQKNESMYSDYTMPQQNGKFYRV